uniref:Pentatricopeptide repeat-containing protein At4g38150 isoform X1 n=1 Tax=Elaeis guineensis var. tenera TaxID=51953 RepID=A0A6J0PBF7_ELAGV|nr:pentatricopeptide repeat-containing protein At4g38150 isoform X1 [Elaeis guineensis]
MAVTGAAVAILPRSLLSSSSSHCHHLLLVFTVSSRRFHSFSSLSAPLLFLKPHYLHRHQPIPCSIPNTRPPLSLSLSHSTSSSSSGSSLTNPTTSFDWSDDEKDGDDGTTTPKSKEKTTTVDDKSRNLPPPYDPFSKKPVIEEPSDPSNLQEIFHKMRTEGLTNHAIKMFDALSKDGLTHEALELFSVIKDQGTMPDVVAHTAVIEAYANAGGQSKDALRTFDRMLASGVSPNAYTYTVLIKGLARDGRLPEVRKYLLEMICKGMRPNTATYLAVFEAYVKGDRTDDARALLEEMKGKGFVPDEKAVRENLSKRGQEDVEAVCVSEESVLELIMNPYQLVGVNFLLLFYKENIGGGMITCQLRQ